MKCCICKKDIFEHGNNPDPIKGEVCCNECNLDVVVPLRLFYLLNISGLVINTNKSIELVKPQNKTFNLKELQKCVEGKIERYPVELPGYIVYVNEEGFILDLEYNKMANKIYDIDAVGKVLIVPEGLLE